MWVGGTKSLKWFLMEETYGHLFMEYSSICICILSSREYVKPRTNVPRKSNKCFYG